MEHNLDYLKCNMHKPTKVFLNSLIDKGILPTIMHPMRITQTSASLIDNVFVSSRLHCSFDSGIILSDISDHLPSLVLLKQTPDFHKEFTSRNLSTKELNLINDRIQSTDWNGLLMSESMNTNFDILSDVISRAMDDVAPLHMVRISGKRRFVEPWMTILLEQSAKKKQRLYKKTLQKNSTKTDVNAYQEYRNTYNRLKRHAQQSYYQKKTLDFKTNTKELGKMINKVICKKRYSGSIIPFITVDGIRIDKPDKIANSFGKFYSTLGSRLASEITEDQYKTEDYLKKIPKNINSMVLVPTTQQEVQQIIDQLPAKSSSGHNDVSNVLLKSLKNSLTYPLTLIYNQSRNEGIFPDKMKLAEVIPLYKNKAMDHLVNYRPISLFMTMSKVLEKLMYKREVAFIDKHDILYRSQYGF